MRVECLIAGLVIGCGAEQLSPFEVHVATDEPELRWSVLGIDGDVRVRMVKVPTLMGGDRRSACNLRLHAIHLPCHGEPWCWRESSTRTKDTRCANER